MTDNIITPEFDPRTRADNKHALYFLFNVNKELIYVGMSRRMNAPIGYQRGWIDEVTTAKLVWFDSKLAAKTALDTVLSKKAPQYNIHRQSTYARLAVPPVELPPGEKIKNACPKCGHPKQRPVRAYCNPCFARYQQERKIARAKAAAAAPAPEVL